MEKRKTRQETQMDIKSRKKKQKTEKAREPATEGRSIMSTRRAGATVPFCSVNVTGQPRLFCNIHPIRPTRNGARRRAAYSRKYTPETAGGMEKGGGNVRNAVFYRRPPRKKKKNKENAMKK